MAVEASFTVVTSDTHPVSHTGHPRFQAQEFSNPGSVASWLSQMADEHYHLLSITPITQTNHFNKEVCSVVWVVVEHDAEPSTPH